MFDKANVDRIFVKACEAKGGKVIFLLARNLLSYNYKEIWNTFREGSYIFQRPIIQHEEINNIFPNSINTL